MAADVAMRVYKQLNLTVTQRQQHKSSSLSENWRRPPRITIYPGTIQGLGKSFETTSTISRTFSSSNLFPSSWSDTGAPW